MVAIGFGHYAGIYSEMPQGYFGDVILFQAVFELNLLLNGSVRSLTRSTVNLKTETNIKRKTQAKQLNNVMRKTFFFGLFLFLNLISDSKQTGKKKVNAVYFS